MTASEVNGNGSRARSGTRALALLAAPLNGTILRKLHEGPMRLVDLRRECGAPAQTTLRAHLKELEAVGAIARRRRNRFPGALEFELTAPAGEELLFVSAAVEHWLQLAPGGPVGFATSESKAAIKALSEGWSSTMIRALAAGPLTLTELDGVISNLNYPSLERRLAAMRLAGQVEAQPSKGSGTPYGVTDWLRKGIAPLAAGARWERRHVPQETAPITRIDTEAAFLLTLPLLRLPAELSGSCRMGVEMRNGQEHRLAGATAHVDQGRIASCTVRLQGDADAWATGSATGWLHAVIGSETGALQMGGDQHLVRALLDGLHRALFGSARRGKQRRKSDSLDADHSIRED